MDKVGHQMGQMGLLKEKEKKDRDLLKRMTKLHIKLGNLAQDSNTEEVGLFRFTPKGLEMARWLRGG